MKSCHQNSHDICRVSWKVVSSLCTIKVYKRKSPKCLVSRWVGKRGRGWERRVENLLLHSASLTLLPLSKLHKTPSTSIVSPALFEHFPLVSPFMPVWKPNTDRIQKEITQTKSNQHEKACKSNRCGSEQHFIKTRDMNCSICVSLASYCSDLLL